MGRRRNHRPVKSAKPALKSMMSSPAPMKVTALHEAALNGPRQQETWGGRVMVGPRTESLMSLPSLRRRSRIEEQSNPIASRTTDIIVASIVGSGVKPVILDEDLADLWEDWEPEMDAEGIAVNFTGYQRLSVAEIVVAGEVLGILRPRFMSDGLAVPLQVQLVPSEHLPVQDANLPANASCGIEFDAIGRQKTYWLYDLNPTEARNRGKAPTLRPVPGSSVIHCYFARRGGQIRGVPMMASGMISMRDVNDYIDLEMNRKKTTAHFGAVVLAAEEGNTPRLNQAAPEEGESQVEGSNEDAEDNDTPYLEELDSGGVMYATNGTDVKVIAPADVGGSYEPFLRSEYRLIAAATGVPYELLIGDIAGTSDRAMKIIMKFYELLVRGWQDTVVQDICRPIWNAFIDAAVSSGAWRPKSADDIARARRTKWIAPPLPAFHAKQEVEADMILVDRGLMSRQAWAAENGGNYRETLREIAEEIRMLEEAGIPLDLATSAIKQRIAGDQE